MRLYTGKGDSGWTDLLSGGRIRKSTERVEAYGTVDELNCSIGLARLYSADSQIDELLGKIQSYLFVLGADLGAVGEGDGPHVTEDDVKWLENTIDGLTSQLRPLGGFIFPGGSKPAAFLHISRAVCRRMERRIEALAQKESVNTQAYRFANRLSSLLFALALLANQRMGIDEVLWTRKR
jgi:cob(I)alamin adenosyltransferase